MVNNTGARQELILIGGIKLILLVVQLTDQLQAHALLNIPLI